MTSLVDDWRRAIVERAQEATQAEAIFLRLVGHGLPRVPGMGTWDRLAMRCLYGLTPEDAALAEYRYRWALALTSRTFGVPHAIDEGPARLCFGAIAEYGE